MVSRYSLADGTSSTQKLLSLLGKGHFFPVIAYVDQLIGNQGICSVQKSGACGNAVSERLIDIFQSPFN